MGCGASAQTNAVPVLQHTNRSTSTARNRQTRINLRPGSVSLAQPKIFHYGKSINKSELERLRDEFWNTRVEGNAIMWQAIKSAAEAILSHDLPLANAILEASNIITTSGLLDLCYDEKGHQYCVPAYCYCDPIELIIGSNNGNATIHESHKTNISDKYAASDKNSTVVGGNDLKVKLRVNPGDYNVVLDCAFINTIADLKKMVTQYSVQSQGKMPVCDESLQRVMFMGKELHNSQTLKQAGIDEVRIVQVFIRGVNPNAKKK